MFSKIGLESTRREKRERSFKREGGVGEGRYREMTRRRAASSRSWGGMTGGVWKKPLVALDGSIALLNCKNDPHKASISDGGIVSN
jgi:hypothetical protein